MTPEPSPYHPDPDPVLGPPAPVRRVPRVAIGVGLTALFGFAGAGLAFAASGGGGAAAPTLSASSPTSTPGPSTKAPQLKPGGRGFRFGGEFGGPAGFAGPVIHAQYTVKDGTTYKTIATQIGQVVSVSGNSITVKSDDGFTQTYTVENSTIVDSQSGGISAVASKDTVRVEALVSGSKQTATNIVDTTKIGASRKGFGFPAAPQGFPGRGGPGGPEGSAPAGPPVAA